MKRTKKAEKQINAILCSDLHIMEKNPVCRTDDIMKAMVNKLEWLQNLQRKYKCPVLCAGDIFDHWKPSPLLISTALKWLPDNLIAIPGQHDLPQHNLELIEKSGFWALVEAGKLYFKYDVGKKLYDQNYRVYLTPFGKSPRQPDKEENNILMLHQLTWQKEPWPGADPKGNARKLLKDNPDFDLIITGDNHQAFTEEYKGRLLVNPGSMLRKSADQIDFRPRVYLWNAESNAVTAEYYPIEKGVLTRQHIDIKEERQNRLDSFIELIQSDEFEITVDFEKNIMKAMEQSKVPQLIKNKVLEAIDNGLKQTILILKCRIHQMMKPRTHCVTQSDN
jgi:DNA repair exonuclease SbcCD nuclease subunit